VTILAGPLHILGEARSYEDIRQALILRADELNISRETLDDASGLPDGFSSKVLSPEGQKSLGPATLGPMLGGLAVKLLIVPDEEQLTRLKKWLANQRDRTKMTLCLPPIAGKHRPKWLFHPRKAKRMAKKRVQSAGKNGWSRLSKRGAKARARALSPERRREIARSGAAARWKNRREIGKRIETALAAKAG